MNNSIEIKPKDLIIKVYTTDKLGGWNISGSRGVSLYHKPSDITINIDKHRSQYKNKSEAVIILQDLLTEFKVGDIVITSSGLSEITSVWDDGCCYLTEDNIGRYEFLETISHTEEGYRYKNKILLEKELKQLEEDYNSKIKDIHRKIEELNNYD